MGIPQVGTTPGERVAINVAHKLRCNILSILSVRVASPNEIAKDLRRSIGDVSYHIRVLRDNGAIELVRERKVRGSTEHFYRAIQSNFVTDEEYATLTPEERIGFCEGTILFGFADAIAAMDSGSMAKRTDHCIARIPATVDEQGWATIAGVLRRTLFEVQEEVFASETRLAEDPSLEPIPLTTQLALFELPAPSRNTLPMESAPVD